MPRRCELRGRAAGGRGRSWSPRTRRHWTASPPDEPSGWGCAPARIAPRSGNTSSHARTTCASREQSVRPGTRSPDVPVWQIRRQALAHFLTNDAPPVRKCWTGPRASWPASQRPSKTAASALRTAGCGFTPHPPARTLLATTSTAWVSATGCYPRARPAPRAKVMADDQDSRALLQARLTAQSLGRRIQLHTPSRQMMRLLELTGADQFFPTTHA